MVSELDPHRTSLHSWLETLAFSCRHSCFNEYHWCSIRKCRVQRPKQTTQINTCSVLPWRKSCEASGRWAQDSKCLKPSPYSLSCWHVCTCMHMGMHSFARSCIRPEINLGRLPLSLRYVIFWEPLTPWLAKWASHESKRSFLIHLPRSEIAHELLCGFPGTRLQRASTH